MIEFLAAILVSIFGGALVLLLASPLIVVSVLTHAYVAHVLWGWFAVPLFHLPALSISAAVGLRLVAGAIVPTPAMPDIKSDETKDKSAKQKAISKIVGSLAAPFIGLLMGWVVKTYFLVLP